MRPYDLINFFDGHSAVEQLALEIQFLPVAGELADLLEQRGDHTAAADDQHNVDHHIERRRHILHELGEGAHRADSDTGTGT